MRLSEEIPVKPVEILEHTTKNSTEQTSMRRKWFKHIAIQIVQEHLLKALDNPYPFNLGGGSPP